MLAHLNRPFFEVAVPKGGFLQRQQQARVRSRSPAPTHRVTPCFGAESLIKDWATGNCSAPRLQKHCLAFTKSSRPVSPAIKRLSETSGSATNDNKRHANLLSLIATCGYDELLKDVPDHSLVSEQVLPSSIFRLLHGRSRDLAFKQRLGAYPDEVEDFWCRLFASSEGEDLRSSHPFLVGKTPRQLRHCLPLVIHEDAGPYSKQWGTNIHCWSSLLGRGSELETKFVISSHISLSQAGYDPAAWQQFLDDLDLLEEGRGFEFDGFVAQDADGTVWSGTWLF